ncbi:ROK family protein [Candidatus Wolfebacteria bacterium]|nr:ROK family protein [Candidatus Wolfebacteria bacterium]
MYYLGIDIGGTKIGAVLMSNFKRHKPAYFVLPTPKNKKDFLKTLEKFVASVTAGKKIKGIGVGIRGAVDSKRGVLLYDKILPFLKGWNIKNFFEKFCQSVLVDNDSRCFLRGEAAWGAARKYKNAVSLTIGTGIGGGIMIDGKIYSGENNTAGEFGNMIIDGGKTLEDLGAKSTFLKIGDRSKIIGIAAANLINAFDPEAVVLGGGGVASKGVKINMVRQAAARRVLPPLKRIPILEGRLGEASSAIGAALLFKK